MHYSLWVSLASVALWLTGCSVPSPEHILCPTDGGFGACCDPAAPCDGDLSCLGPDELSFCTQPCGPSGPGCPQGSSCKHLEGEAVCVPNAGRVGDACDPEHGDVCRPGLFCLRHQGMGVCTALCDAENLCPPKALVGDRVCVELSNDAGTYCTRPCEEAADCASGLGCTAVAGTGWSVCFPSLE